MKSLGTKILSGVLPLFIWACSGSNAPSNAAAQKNAINQMVSTPNGQKTMMTIRQGTVGKIGNYSVGVRGINSASDAKTTVADLAVWNSALPQIKRNDYNITFAVKSGETIPIGSGFYEVGKIAENRGDAPSGSVEIESQPSGVSDVKLGESSLAIPVGGILELHGVSVEFVSITAENGRLAAEVELYSNDYPKQDLEKKSAVKRISVAAGEMISIDSIKHKVINVYSPKDGSFRGVLELAISPEK